MELESESLNRSGKDRIQRRGSKMRVIKIGIVRNNELVIYNCSVEWISSSQKLQFKLKQPTTSAIIPIPNPNTFTNPRFTMSLLFNTRMKMLVLSFSSQKWCFKMKFSRSSLRDLRVKLYTPNLNAMR